MLNPVESTEYSRQTTLVYIQEYPITLPLDGVSQMSRLNARCSPMTLFYCTDIAFLVFSFITLP